MGPIYRRSCSASRCYSPLWYCFYVLLHSHFDFCIGFEEKKKTRWGKLVIFYQKQFSIYGCDVSTSFALCWILFVLWNPGYPNWNLWHRKINFCILFLMLPLVMLLPITIPVAPFVKACLGLITRFWSWFLSPYKRIPGVNISIFLQILFINLTWL